MSRPQRLRAHAYGHTEQCKDDKRTIKIKSWVRARLTGPQGTICLTVYFLFYLFGYYLQLENITVIYNGLHCLRE